MEPFPRGVLVAVDDPDAGEALVDSLARVGLEVAGVASDAAEAIEMALRTSPAVALIDVQLPGGGTEATKGIAGAGDGCRVIALSAFEDRGAVLQMLLAGAVGYTIKDAPPSELLAAVRAAQAQTDLTVDVMKRLMGDLLHEIADRSEMEDRLRRSERKFRSLLESAPDAVVIVDRLGEIVLVNRRTELMFGYEREDLLGKGVEVLLPERFHLSHKEHRREYGSSLRTRRMGIVAGLVARRRDGTEFPVDVSLSALESEDGPLITAFVREMSEGGWAAGDARGHGRDVLPEAERDQLIVRLALSKDRSEHTPLPTSAVTTSASR